MVLFEDKYLVILPGKFHGQKSLVGYAKKKKKRVGYYLEPNNNKIQLSWKS